jgi:acetyltransferase-like isoleucine patch superfamily enzyme
MGAFLMASYVEYTTTVPPGETHLVPKRANVVRVLEASSTFKIGVGNSPTGLAFKGLKFKEDSGKFFSKIILDNLEGAGAVAVTLGLGIGDVDDSRISGTVSVVVGSGIQSGDDVAVGAGVTLLCAANTSRLELILCALTANTAVIRIGDPLITMTRGHPLEPGQSVVLNTTAAVYGIRLGAGQTVSVVEMMV